MSIKIGHAVMDELGKTIGATPGDQTGKEIAISTWYAKNSAARTAAQANELSIFIALG